MNKTTLTTTAATAMLLTGLSMNLAADSDSKETAAAQQAAKTTIAEQTTGGKSSTLHTGHRKFWLPALQFRDSYRHNLKRSSAIQQGLLNISIFLLSLFLLSLLTYLLVQSTLSSRLDSNLQQRMVMLLERVSSDDDEDDEYESYDYKKPHEVINDGNFFLMLQQSDLKSGDDRYFRKTGYATYRFNWNKQRDDDDVYRTLVEHKMGGFLS